MYLVINCCTLWVLQAARGRGRPLTTGLGGVNGGARRTIGDKMVFSCSCCCCIHGARPHCSFLSVPEKLRSWCLAHGFGWGRWLGDRWGWQDAYSVCGLLEKESQRGAQRIGVSKSKFKMKISRMYVRHRRSAGKVWSNRKNIRAPLTFYNCFELCHGLNTHSLVSWFGGQFTHSLLFPTSWALSTFRARHFTFS